MRPEIHFIESINEITDLLRPGCSEYQLLRLSGIFRKLLLDGFPLVDQINIWLAPFYYGWN